MTILKNNQSLKRFGITAIAVFWTVQFIALTLDRFVRGSDLEATWESIPPRAAVTLFAIAYSLILFFVLRRVARWTLIRRAAVAGGLALLGTIFHVIANLFANALFRGIEITPGPGESWASSLVELLSFVNVFFWIYAAIALLLLALTYVDDLLDRDALINELALEADRARLQALRYQLNPHFLFNALNSTVSLISAKRNAEAEFMVEHLADFLRSTLRLAPSQEISLGEELELQSLYLGVEKIRFPDRLHVLTDVPERVRNVLVPNLITQPIIENVIKHSVARSDATVHLEISAREEDSKLIIEIRDDGGNAEVRSGKGTSVGIQNVARRLDLHFGDKAEFHAGPLREGGFAVLMSMPARRAQCPA